MRSTEFSSYSILAVIPARKGSKGIPRKNMRLLNGRPLISYAIENALASRYIDDIAVSTDSEEILSFVEQYVGVVPLKRGADLAQDAVTLDPVVYDAVIQMEDKRRIRYDAIVTLQPTSPLLTVEVLDNAIQSFMESQCDSMISVVNAPHLSWKKDSSGKIIPAYEKRLNRQQLPPSYLETGAFLLTRRESVAFDTRLGSEVGVFEMPAEQAVDIDAKEDWAVCEAVLSRKTIAFRVDGHRSLGLGHINRALSLAYELMGHNVVFLCNPSYPLGIECLHNANMHVEEVPDTNSLLTWLDGHPVDIFVCDLLDTERDFVSAVKQRVGRFVSFEDMGEGMREADAVVNALYEGAPPGLNVYSGKRYACLRDEFLTARPIDYTDKVSRILVTFGGTDPLNLTERIYRIAQTWNTDIEFDFVLGAGYKGTQIEPSPDLGLQVSRDITRMSDHMRKSQLAVCSQGRTTFELAAMGVPAIVLAQNDREQLHAFAQMDNGFINLGIGTDVSDEDIESALRWIVGAKTVRREMHNRMLANDLRSGMKRVKRIILGETL